MSNDENDATPLAVRPGRSIQRVLQTMPEKDRLPFLAYLVQAAGRSQDDEILEAVRDYRLLVEGKAYLRIVPRMTV